MIVWKCKTCGGSYADTQADGSIYFHACAALPPDPQGHQAEQPGKRDENLTLDARGRISGIKSAGAGVVAVSITPLTQPAWLTQITAAAAAIAAGG